MGIGLVYVLWKVCALVVNCQLKRIAVLHDALHRIITGKGTGTATSAIEAMLSQQLSWIAQETLFQVFLDVPKAYDFLDRDRCLELLRGYWLGPNLGQLLKNYWRRQRIVPKVGKYLGTAFGTGIGVTQGDPASPTVFRIVVDVVVHVVLE